MHTIDIKSAVSFEICAYVCAYVSNAAPAVPKAIMHMTSVSSVEK